MGSNLGLQCADGQALGVLWTDAGQSHVPVSADAGGDDLLHARAADIRQPQFQQKVLADHFARLARVAADDQWRRGLIGRRRRRWWRLRGRSGAPADTGVDGGHGRRDRQNPRQNNTAPDIHAATSFTSAYYRA
jgi:hypothetical protein